MKVNTAVVDAYIRAEDLSPFAQLWLYEQETDAGRENIFTQPESSEEKRRQVEQIKTEMLTYLQNFEPCNVRLWDALFETWRPSIEQTEVDLVVGCPELYDAFVKRDTRGQAHMIFDLLNWEKYLGHYPITDLVQNLLSHELMHVQIGQVMPDIEAAEERGSYLEKLDAITFNEGFAHLLSYEIKGLETVDWATPAMQEVYTKAQSQMRAALQAQDPARQADFVQKANFGQYTDKYACMCGMIYLGQMWQKGGYPDLKQLFEEGYKGFAAKTLQLP